MLPLMQAPAASDRQLLTALEVQERLNIDRSTVYRMADDGRLPSIRVGRARRFPAAAIAALAGEPSNAPVGGGLPFEPSTSPDAASPAQPSVAEARLSAVAQATIDVASELLGVMMVVTDMDGRPLTEIANPCPWLAERRDDTSVIEECIAEWRALAAERDLSPHFTRSTVGFECARTFIRSGNRLVGMVLAGGVTPLTGATDEPLDRAGLHDLDPNARDRVLTTLPRIAAAISAQVPQVAGA